MYINIILLLKCILYAFTYNFLHLLKNYMRLNTKTIRIVHQIKSTFTRSTTPDSVRCQSNCSVQLRDKGSKNLRGDIIKLNFRKQNEHLYI